MRARRYADGDGRVKASAEPRPPGVGGHHLAVAVPTGDTPDGTPSVHGGRVRLGHVGLGAARERSGDADVTTNTNAKRMVSGALLAALLVPGAVAAADDPSNDAFAAAYAIQSIPFVDRTPDAAG